MAVTRKAEVLDVDFDLTGLFGQGENTGNVLLDTEVVNGVYESYRAYHQEVSLGGKDLMAEYQVVTYPGSGLIDARILLMDDGRELLGWRTIRLRKKRMGFLQRQMIWEVDDDVAGLNVHDEELRFFVARFFVTELGDAYSLVLADVLANELKGQDMPRGGKRRQI